MDIAIRRGKPTCEISAEAANDAADLVVVGAHGAHPRNHSADMAVIRGVGLDDGRGVPTELQELCVEEAGEAVHRGLEKRACQACLGVFALAGLVSELGGVLNRDGQRSVDIEIAKIVRRAALVEVIADLDDGDGKPGEDVGGKAVDPQGVWAWRASRSVESSNATTRLR